MAEDRAQAEQSAEQLQAMPEGGADRVEEPGNAAAEPVDAAEVQQDALSQSFTSPPTLTIPDVCFVLIANQFDLLCFQPRKATSIGKHLLLRPVRNPDLDLFHQPPQTIRNHSKRLHGPPFCF